MEDCVKGKIVIRSRMFDMIKLEVTMWNNKKFVYNLEKSKTLGHRSLHGIFFLFYCIDNDQLNMMNILL